ncbi:hypothetical protein HDU96_009666 [Phlyctochytrium bullatum]|nr:hypothetical protein HDU96_009666 [Phlyctochytrium bullatum]
MLPIDANTATGHQDSSSNDDTDDALVTERLLELMAEEYRLPRFDNDPLDAAAQADLEKALATVKGFFKDEDPEANPEVLEYFKWKDLNMSRFFQEVLRLFPHHSAIVVEFLDNQPAQIKRLMAVFHDRYVLPFSSLSTPKTDLDLPLGNVEGYDTYSRYYRDIRNRILDSDSAGLNSSDYVYISKSKALRLVSKPTMYGFQYALLQWKN